MTNKRFEELLSESMKSGGDYIEENDEWNKPFSSSPRFMRRMGISGIYARKNNIIKRNISRAVCAASALIVSAAAMHGFPMYADTGVETREPFDIGERKTGDSYKPNVYLDADRIETYYEITYDLSKLGALKRAEFDRDFISQNDYYNFDNEGTFRSLWFDQDLCKNFISYLSTEGLEKQKVYINGFMGYYSEIERTFLDVVTLHSYVIWHDDYCVYSLIAENIDKELLLEIAESVKPIENLPLTPIVPYIPYSLYIWR